MKFVEVRFIDTYAKTKDTETLIIKNDADQDKAVELIDDAGKTWQDLDTEDRNDYGGYWDFMVDKLREADIDFEWFSQDAIVIVRD